LSAQKSGGKKKKRDDPTASGPLGKRKKEKREGVLYGYVDQGSGWGRLEKACFFIGRRAPEEGREERCRPGSKRKMKGGGSGGNLPSRPPRQGGTGIDSIKERRGRKMKSFASGKIPHGLRGRKKKKGERSMVGALPFRDDGEKTLLPGHEAKKRKGKKKKN